MSGDSATRRVSRVARDLLLALPLGDLRRHPCAVYGRHVLERRDDAEELVQLRVVGAQRARQRLDGRDDTRAAPARGLIGSSCSK